MKSVLALSMNQKKNVIEKFLKVAKALILHSYFSDGNHFDDEDKLYEMAAEVLGEFYDKNGIDHLYDIDDVEY